MKTKLNIAVLIYPDVELMDMNGPIDAFLRANALNGKKYHIYTVASCSCPIYSEDKIVVIAPNYTVDNCPEPDVIVIPGITPRSENVATQKVVEWLTEMGRLDKILLSVCIGIYTLVRTDLLIGRKITTHYSSINAFHKTYPNIEIVKNVRFVDDGNIISTGGITSGIDGALHLIERFDGPLIAQQAADFMVYNRDAPLPPFTILPPYYN